MRRHLCSPCIFAVVMIMLLPLLQWQCCHHQAGGVALVTMASTPLSMPRRLWCCHNGIVALIALAPLPTLHRRCHPCCAGIVVLIALTSSSLYCMGAVTVVAPVLLPPLSWRVCTIALVPLSLSCWWCHSWYTGISTLVAQALSPLLCFCHAVNLQASLPLLSWHVLSRRQRGRPCRRQRQHKRNKGNSTSTTRAARPAQWGK
jgi:hypothetical protein